MSDTDTGTSPKLHEVDPREIAGRDSTSRDQAQFRAAAHECLSLLEDESLDRVYSDFQDDFVSRINKDGKTSYRFYQVKTKDKRNHQWSTNDMFGIEKRRKAKGATKPDSEQQKLVDPQKIADSFVGKMIVHTIKFKNSCAKVTFLTNVHFHDDVEDCLVALVSGTKGNVYYDLLVENFNNAFASTTPIPDVQVVDLLKKISLKPNISFLSPDDEEFAALARSTIYKYSEIDLLHQECEEIVRNLVALVARKSFRKLIGAISETELDEKAGIGLAEMLDIMSISKGAYKQLKAGGDEKAIRNASIIQRLLKQSGAADDLIEFVSSCKVKWDIWLREKRHIIPEFDINLILEQIEIGSREWRKDKKGALKELNSVVAALLQEFKPIPMANSLDREHLVGAIFSSIVRNESL